MYCMYVCVLCASIVLRDACGASRGGRAWDLRRDLASRWFTISLICADGLVLLQLIAKVTSRPPRCPPKPTTPSCAACARELTAAPGPHDRSATSSWNATCCRYRPPDEHRESQGRAGFQRTSGPADLQRRRGLAARGDARARRARRAWTACLELSRASIGRRSQSRASGATRSRTRYAPNARLAATSTSTTRRPRGCAAGRPHRRSVTWLVYLNDGWAAVEGGEPASSARRARHRGGRARRQPADRLARRGGDARLPRRGAPGTPRSQCTCRR